MTICRVKTTFIGKEYFAPRLSWSIFLFSFLSEKRSESSKTAIFNFLLVRGNIPLFYVTSKLILRKRTCSWPFFLHRFPVVLKGYSSLQNYFYHLILSVLIVSSPAFHSHFVTQFLVILVKYGGKCHRVRKLLDNHIIKKASIITSWRSSSPHNRPKIYAKHVRITSTSSSFGLSKVLILHLSSSNFLRPL